MHQIVRDQSVYRRQHVQGDKGDGLHAVQEHLTVPKWSLSFYMGSHSFQLFVSVLLGIQWEGLHFLQNPLILQTSRNLQPSWVFSVVYRIIE